MTTYVVVAKCMWLDDSEYHPVVIYAGGNLAAAVSSPSTLDDNSEFDQFCLQTWQDDRFVSEEFFEFDGFAEE
jgi:hypothetical protein